MCCQNLGSLCANDKQKYGDRVMEEKERVALLLCEAKGEHCRLAPQELCLPSWWVGKVYIVRWEYVVRINPATVLYFSFFRSFKRGDCWPDQGVCRVLSESVTCTVTPGSSVHGISQARILEWVAIPFSKGSSRPRNQTWVFCIAGKFLSLPSEPPAGSSVVHLLMLMSFCLRWFLSCSTLD